MARYGTYPTLISDVFQFLAGTIQTIASSFMAMLNHLGFVYFGDELQAISEMSGIMAYKMSILKFYRATFGRISINESQL